MKRFILISVFLVGAASAAQATTYTYQFNDVAKPHGHVRGAATRHADGRACGASANLDMPKNIPVFEKCMAAKGWRFARITVSKSPVVAQRAPAFDLGQSTSDDDAAQAEEEANDEAARNSAWQTQQAEQTQDMINTQNEVNNENAIAAQEQANASAAASFAMQMTVGN